MGLFPTDGIQLKYESSNPTLANGQTTQSRCDVNGNLLVNVASGTINVDDTAASSTSSGTVAATNAAGGTTIIAANSGRRFAQCQNNGSVDVYYGTGTVTSSFLKVVPGGTFAWHSVEALKVLSSGANCNIAYCDYTN